MKKLFLLCLAFCTIEIAFCQNKPAESSKIELAQKATEAAAAAKVALTDSAGFFSKAKKEVSAQFQAIADSNKLTFSKVYGDAKAGLIGLASALKVGAEHVYIVLVKQQVVYSISWLGISLVFILIPLLWFNKLIAWCRDKEDIRDGSQWLAFVFGCCAPILIGFIVLINNFSLIVTGFVNPEYGAIHEIINFVK